MGLALQHSSGQAAVKNLRAQSARSAARAFPPQVHTSLRGQRQARQLVSSRQRLSTGSHAFSSPAIGLQTLPSRRFDARLTTSRRQPVVAFAAGIESKSFYTGGNSFSYLPAADTEVFEAGVSAAPRQLPRAVEGAADNPQLANPLERHNRLGTGWMGVIMEYEGVVVDDCGDLHTKAWLQLADEQDFDRPQHWMLKRAEGMKNEQVVEEVLHWSRNAMEVRRLCARKEEMFRELRGSITPAIPPGTMTLLEVLERNNVPVALACSAPETRVMESLEAMGLLDFFPVIVCAEDVARGRPDPDGILYAAQQIERPPIRCVLIGVLAVATSAALHISWPPGVTVAGITAGQLLGAVSLKCVVCCVCLALT